MRYKILITGVAGFIGSNLAKRLVSLGHDVIGIGNLAYGKGSRVPDGVLFFKEDIFFPVIKNLTRVFLTKSHMLPILMKVRLSRRSIMN